MTEINILTDLEAGSPRSECQRDGLLESPLSGLQTATFLLYSQWWREKLSFSLTLLSKH